MKLLKKNTESIICIFILGMITGCFLFGSCSKMTFLQGVETFVGSDLDYNIGDGVTSSWENKNPKLSVDKQETALTMDDENQSGLFMFKNNEFKPSCCTSQFSNSQGCACITKEQANYLNRRGGNRARCGNTKQSI